ncbi:MAG TPA: site-specific integrase [Mesorhizobium sp.]|jgi:integrase|nr:site-specific integrase [Mesorhizobium sp.]
MPQNRLPPRLFPREERDKRTGHVTVWWVIRDGKRQKRTGCLEAQIAEAERKLADYIAGKYEPPKGGKATKVTIADVLMTYAEDKAADTANPKLTVQAIARLNAFMGDKPVAEIKAKLCNAYAAHRQTPSGARRDLEVLRAATNHYNGEHGLDVLPKFTLPEKSLPRERHLTRSEAAALLWACLGWEKVGAGENSYWVRHRDQKRAHLARLVLIGLYTGTRPGAILSLQWMPNVTGGWVNLEKGVIFRRAEGERVAHNKRKPPVKMAPRLKVHMARWRRLDQGLKFVVHYQGAQITKPNKAFRSAIAAAGLTKEVTPHVLRHTRATWLAEAGVSAREAAASLGLTEQEYERTYLHNDPEFQKSAAEAY